MLFFILKTIFVSLLLIALVHYLYGFFKNTLTVPKVKDLVNKPAQRYNQMFAGLKTENEHTKNMIAERNVGAERSVDQQNMDMGQQSMQAELNSFLNELKKPTTTQQNAIPTTTQQNAIPTMQQNAVPNANFSAANESAFGAYTHLFM
jgi:hypothetical protein